MVLGLVLVAAMLALHALSGAAGAAALSRNRILHQRAFEAAERGLAAIRQRIEAGEVVPPSRLQLASELLPTESATVEYRQTARLSLSPGFSSGRFVEERGELKSTARVTTTATARLVEGISRIVPQDASP